MDSRVIIFWIIFMFVMYQFFKQDDNQTGQDEALGCGVILFIMLVIGGVINYFSYGNFWIN